LELNDLIRKYKVKEHEEIRDNFLIHFERTMQIGRVCHPNEDENIFTDYFYNVENTDVDAIYKSYALDVLGDYIKDYLNNLSISYENTHSMWWFQQYYKSGAHGWHLHGGQSTFAMIYYVELPHSEQATEIHNVDITLEEGDFLIFPAFLPHRSSPNKFEERKSVLVSNFGVNDVIL